MKHLKHLGLLPLLMAIGACSTAKKKDVEGSNAQTNPLEVARQVCSIGSGNNEITGSVWIQADSVEASGRFPAEVLVRSDRYLDLEVLNPLGGTEAQIQVRGDHYEVKVPGKKNRDRAGSGSWGGIPLNWSHELFLGRVPCPTSEKLSAASVAWVQGVPSGTQLEVVSTGAKGEREVYRYQLANAGGQYWPERLDWERDTAKGPLQVKFIFEMPADDSTRSPRKWEAKSKRGEVVIRWREREVKTN